MTCTGRRWYVVAGSQRSLEHGSELLDILALLAVDELALFFQEKGRLETVLSRGVDADHDPSAGLLGQSCDEELFGCSWICDI